MIPDGKTYNSKYSCNLGTDEPCCRQDQNCERCHHAVETYISTSNESLAYYPLVKEEIERQHRAQTRYKRNKKGWWRG